MNEIVRTIGVAPLDPHQQLEAFAADGEEVDAGKVIARTSGFADVLLAGERVALNLLQHLSGIATITREYVRAIEGTRAKIGDTRKSTPGLRMLEKYAVLLGGGAPLLPRRMLSSRLHLDSVEQEAQFVARLDRVFEAKITVGRDLMRIALG